MRRSILIVDDAEFMRVMLRDIVEDMGCEVVGETGHGKRAGQMYEDLRPDLVLLDITMPDRDGTEALGDILRIDPAATVVMISALGQKNQVLSAIKAGAMDFVVKPFDHDRIHETLSRLFEATPV